MKNQNDKYWLWLSSLTTLSQKTRSEITAEYDRTGSICGFPRFDGAGLHIMKKADAEALKESAPAAADSIISLCGKYGISYVTYSDERYPERLKNVFAPPFVLYYLGNFPDFDNLPVISVIGTRKSSLYGEKMGLRLAYEISACGGTVLSLLTPGTGEAAAEGATSDSSACIVLPGTALGASSLKKYGEYTENGTVISEYPPESKTNRSFFRERNRLAAGLSVGVVVVEAPEKSGTALFVEDALEQGKDVFAVPGNADEENSTGTFQLLKLGAKPVMSGWDVMQEYAGLFSCVKVSDKHYSGDEHYTENKTKKPDKSGKAGRGKNNAGDGSDAVDKPKGTEYIDREDLLKNLSEEQRSIVKAISSEGSLTDEVISASGLGAAKVLAQLTILEIKGIIQRDASRRIVLNLEKK